MKPTFLTLIIFLFFGSSLSFSQNYVYDWAHQMGGGSLDQGNSITVDAAGNIYTTGYFQGTVDFDPSSNTFNLTSAGGRDIFIKKTDANGNFIWAKRMGAVSSDDGLAITTDASGNVYTTGKFVLTVDFDPGPGVFNLTSISSGDAFIQKLDANGDFQWAKMIGGSNEQISHSIEIDDSNNIYTAGYFYSTVDFDPGPGVMNLTSAGSSDIYVQKLDSNGDFLWAKGFGGTMTERGFAMDIDSLGNTYTTGYFAGTADFDPGPAAFNYISNGANDIFVQKMDANGNFLWAKQMGGSTFDLAYSIHVDNSGNVYTNGYFNNSVDFDPGPGSAVLSSSGSDDIFIQKLDGNGDYIWAKRIGGSTGDRGFAVTSDASGNVYSTGYFEGTVDFDPGTGSTNLSSISSTADIYIHKMDANGNFLWAKQMGGSDFDFGNAITVDAINNTYTTGAFRNTADFDPGAGTVNLTSAGSADIFIQKMTPCLTPVTGTDVITACSGFTWIDGISYTSNNSTATFNIIGGASSGCDSLVTLDLTIATLPPATGTDVLTECNTYTWIDGNTYTSNNNTATFNIAGGAFNGCDSLVTLDLTIVNSTNGTETLTECNSYTWIDGNTYTSSNNTATYNIIGGASNGCDSLVSLDLTILNSASGTEIISECTSYTWIDGNTYTSSNNTATYNLAGSASNGCDSIVTLDLTILNATTGTDTLTECGSYTWIDGNTYTSDNSTATFNIIGGAINGCDSLVTLDLTIETVNVNTTLNGITITSDAAGASYQWLDCDSAMIAIPGETGQSFTPTSNGNYAVRINENDCIDTSACVAVTTVGIVENSFNEQFVISPNPTKGRFSIEFDKVQQNLSVRLSSASGKIIQEYNFQDTNLIELELNQPRGVYLLELRDDKGEKTVLRIMKQ